MTLQFFKVFLIFRAFYCLLRLRITRDHPIVSATFGQMQCKPCQKKRIRNYFRFSTTWFTLNPETKCSSTETHTSPLNSQKLLVNLDSYVQIPRHTYDIPWTISTNDFFKLCSPSFSEGNYGTICKYESTRSSTIGFHSNLPCTSIIKLAHECTSFVQTTT